MAQSNQFPGPEPGDPEDVAWTLTTAGTMWSRGELHEAVRWLRRAAEAAGESGNDLRAVSLASAAADLTSSIDAGGAGPSTPSADQTSRMQVPPVSRPDNPRPISPVDDADGRYDAAEYTIPEGLKAAEPPPFRPPPMPGRPVPSRPPPPSARSQPHSAPPTPSRPAPPASRPAPSGSQQPAASRPSPSVRPPGSGPASLSMRSRQTLRVAVEPSPDDRNLLLVRPLSEDESVPAGAHEALLVALEPGAHLMSKKR